MRGVQIGQQRFFRHDLVVRERQPVEHHAAQAADEDAVLPLRKQVAGVESEAGGRDHRIPVIDRLLHALLVGDAFADRRARIVDAVHDHRPAVVLALLDDVELVAAARTVLGFPQAAGPRIERQAFLAADAIGPDLGQDARLAEERIVGRRRAVGRDVNDLAEMGVQPLRHVPRRRIRAVADGHEQVAVGPDRDAAAGLAAEPLGRHGRLGSEDDLHVGQGPLRFIQPRPRDIGIAVGAVDEIEEA